MSTSTPDQDRIRAFFSKNDRLARHLGIELVEVRPGYARVQMPIKEHHLNGVNTVHGGAICSMADFAFAVASNSHGQVAVAINIDIAYLKPATSGVLYAEATEVSCKKTLGLYGVRVTNDKGELVSEFRGMAYRRPEQILDFEGEDKSV